MLENVVNFPITNCLRATIPLVIFLFELYISFYNMVIIIKFEIVEDMLYHLLWSPL